LFGEVLSPDRSHHGKRRPAATDLLQNNAG
jgi:hypothetical protein